MSDEEKRKGEKKKIDGNSLMISTRGLVIARSLKSRASDDRNRGRERRRKNVHTCLYLFYIISAALPKVSRRPTGFAQPDLFLSSFSLSGRFVAIIYYIR